MTDIRERLIRHFCPEYEDIEYTVLSYSESELNMLDEFPDDIEDLDRCIRQNIEWEDVISHINYLFEEDDFYDSHEDALIDYCDGSIITSSSYGYHINLENFKDIAKACIGEDEEDKWHLKENINKHELEHLLNRYSEFKFLVE